MCKFCWISLVITLAIIIGLAYKFIFSGQVIDSVDDRQVIQLLPTERKLVLAEMRAFLESVQQITQGISEKDMPTVNEAARRVGVAAQAEVPGTLVGKLPLGFKKLGFDTHKKFDMLALDAGQLEDPEHALEQLAELMNNCTSCHATYRLESQTGYSE